MYRTCNVMKRSLYVKKSPDMPMTAFVDLHIVDLSSTMSTLMSTFDDHNW
jgi:hypothetical protein